MLSHSFHKKCLMLYDRWNQVLLAGRYSWHLKLKYSLLHLKVKSWTLQSSDMGFLVFVFNFLPHVYSFTTWIREGFFRIGFCWFPFIYLFIYVFCKTPFHLHKADKINYTVLQIIVHKGHLLYCVFLRYLFCALNIMVWCCCHTVECAYFPWGEDSKNK